MLVCAAEMALMSDVCSGGDEAYSLIRPKDSWKPAAGSRAVLRLGHVNKHFSLCT